ncbi:hypothetical protein CLI64_18600 [Nostoc sp. CENA543]|nr:hypothetical protein CLI64_18600 [Nostoc sp. CENA543]
MSEVFLPLLPLLPLLPHPQSPIPSPQFPYFPKAQQKSLNILWFTGDDVDITIIVDYSVYKVTSYKLKTLD